MSRKLFLLFILLIAAGQAAFSQTIKNDNEELKKEAAIFLRETAVDVGNLRTLENRISFSAEIASLMWYHDEREAQALFQKVINDFRLLLTQIDSQFTALEVAKSETGEVRDDSEGSERKLRKKFAKIMSVRQQIALSIADHDPQMAYDFFNGTAQIVTNKKLREQFDSADSYFESKLVNLMAEKDVDKALELGRKMLAKGSNFQTLELLKKIYDKDAAKGATFADEIFQKAKSETDKSVSLHIMGGLLKLGAENHEKIKNKPDKKPLISEPQMREIADVLAQEILKSSTPGILGPGSYELPTYLSLIEKYAPARAAQIRQKLDIKETSRVEVRTVVGVDDAEPVIMKPTQIKTDAAENEDDYFQSVLDLGGKKLSKEEREKSIKESREKISKIKSREQKLVALSFLAAQVSLSGDKELAAEIMNEARSLVNLQPKNYKDFLLVWMLASGYAAADAEKAFPILEDAISRLNETIAAFIKIGEFIDVEEEIIEGDEVQLGSFGGSMTREMLGALGASNPTILGLAMTDFARTKALTNRFDRLEVRILAKMLVLRAVLGDKKIVAEN